MAIMNIKQDIKRHLPLVILNLVVMMFFLFHVSGVMHWRFIDQIENHAYDFRMFLSMKHDQDPRIVIVDIDENSLAEEGRWPWGRDRLAALLDELFNYYQVTLVGFDVLFAEPDESSGLRILEQLAEGEFADISEYKERLDGIRQELDYDRIFANSMSGRPVILGFYFNTSTSTAGELKTGSLPKPVLTKDQFKGELTDLPVAQGYGANLSGLQDQASGGGHFNPSVDGDGVIRRVPMFYEFEDNVYESLSLSIFRHIFDVDKIELVFGDDLASQYGKLEYINIGGQLIPVDEKSQVMVPYRGRQGSFHYISATDVIRGRADPATLKNSIILVGTSAPGLFDLRSTPIQNKYPGVEIHANLIAGLLDDVIKERPAYVTGAEFLSVSLIGLVISLFIPILSPVWAAISIIMLFLITISFNYIIWQYANLVMPIASTMVMILVLFLLNMSYGFFIERRSKGELTELFGQYVPPELVDEMSEDPAAYSLEPEDRDMTVLFSDVRGFTTISEGLNSRELSELMNEFLTPLTKVIHENRGTIDKYMGDAIMAFWGAPVKDLDHAQHAMQAGLAMIERMYALRDDLLERGLPELKIGVGINSGVMNVGNMGSEFRMAYTVMGDAVNLGSRLEGLTKTYGIDLMVGEGTKDKLPDYVFRKLDQVQVKGKAEPVNIYEPLGLTFEVSTEELDELRLYNEALRNYLNQEWRMAKMRFQNLQRMFTGRKLYDLYLDRTNYFDNNPPGDDWDGVFVFTTK
jgi:adenylate cyclase